MPNLMSRGISWLASKAFEAAGETVTVTRASASISITAMVGGPYAFRVDNGDGVTALMWADQEFFIKASDYVFASVRAIPQRGDKFTRTVDGRTRVYETMNAPGEQCWKWHDANQETIRIHTKLSESFTP